MAVRDMQLTCTVSLAAEVKEKRQTPQNWKHCLQLFSGAALSGAQEQHQKSGLSRYNLLTGSGY